MAWNPAPARVKFPRWRGSWGRQGVLIEVERELGFLLDAFLPRLADVPSSISLRVRMWHSGLNPFQLVNPAWRAERCWSAGEPLSGQLGSHGRIAFDPFSRTVTWHSRDASRASIWVEDPACVRYWICAVACAARILDLWLGSHGMLVCHAAAFTVGEQAVLLIGAGGSGKSTLSVQAASMGFGFLGDDYTLLEPGSPPMAHALYRSAKLANQAMPRIQPAFPDVPGDEKQVVFIDSAALVSSAAVAAVIAPQIAHLGSPSIEPISPAEAVRIAAPSTLQQLPGNEARKLRILARTFTGLPCFRLHLARDSGKNVLAIERTMQTLRSRGAHG